MAAIQRIKRVQGIGVFHDFSWTAGLDDFQSYNLIYGLNGSGKTTLSNILRCLELKKCTEGQFTVTADGADILSAVLQTHAAIPQVKVFNRDFVTDNVFTSFGTCCPAEHATPALGLHPIRLGDSWLVSCSATRSQSSPRSCPWP